MGSLINRDSNKRKNYSGSYSRGKQKNWHYIDGENMPAPRPLGQACRVEPALYCHVDASSIVIP